MYLDPSVVLVSRPGSLNIYLSLRNLSFSLKTLCPFMTKNFNGDDGFL